MGAARLRAAALAVGLAAGLLPGSARADGQLRYDAALDGAVTLGGGALWITSELLKAQLAPSTCRWCDPPGIDVAVRDALKSGSTAGPDLASGVLGFVGMPLLALGGDALLAHHDGRIAEFPVDALVIVESAVVAADLNQLTKFVVGRERPFVHALPPDQKGLTSQPSDNDVSFFSGHTTLAFSLAAASGTVASMRGYRAAPAIWAVGMTVAALVGYLRIAADKHYFTDVLTGAVVGAGVGIALPYLFHRPHGTDVTVAPMAGGAAVNGMTVSGVF